MIYNNKNYVIRIKTIKLLKQNSLQSNMLIIAPFSFITAIFILHEIKVYEIFLGFLIQNIQEKYIKTSTGTVIKRKLISSSMKKFNQLQCTFYINMFNICLKIYKELAPFIFIATFVYLNCLFTFLCMYRIRSS